MRKTDGVDKVLNYLRENDSIPTYKLTATFISDALEWADFLPRNEIGALAVNDDLFVFKYAWQLFLAARMEKGQTERGVSERLKSFWLFNDFDPTEIRRTDMEISFWRQRYPQGAVRTVIASPDDYDHTWDEFLAFAVKRPELIPYFAVGILDVKTAERYHRNNVDPALATAVGGGV